MRDTALAGWGEFAPLIIFLVLGWLANRAKQKKEAEAAAKPGRPMPPGPAQGGRPAPAPSPARRETGGQGPHAVDDGEDVEDWTGEDWDGEHSERWDDHQGGEVRTEQPRPAEDRVERLRPSPPPPASRPEAQRNVPADRDAGRQPIIPSKAKEKAAEVGKDLLSQLAKELGLELPQPGKPVPRPAPKPAPAPQPSKAGSPKAPAHGHAPKSYTISPDELRARAAEAGRSRPAIPGMAAPMPMAPAKSLIAAGDLSDVDSLRKAVILKTILEKPRALKPHGRKPD